MDKFSELESRLAALSPKGLSSEARVRLDETIDELALQDEMTGDVQIIDSPQKSRRSLWGQAAAAVAIAAFLGLSLSQQGMDSPDAGDGQAQVADGLTESFSYSPVGSRDLIESWEDEGVSLKEGAEWPIRQVRFDVVSEEKFIDPASGVVVTVVSPSQEVHMTPHYSF